MIEPSRVAVAIGALLAERRAELRLRDVPGLDQQLANLLAHDGMLPLDLREVLLASEDALLDEKLHHGLEGRDLLALHLLDRLQQLGGSASPAAHRGHAGHGGPRAVPCGPRCRGRRRGGAARGLALLRRARAHLLDDGAALGVHAP